MRYWGAKGDSLIAKAIKESSHLYGLNIQFADIDWDNLDIGGLNPINNPTMFSHSFGIPELTRQIRATHSGIVALTLLQGLTQPGSNVYCLRTNFDLIRMILERICPDTIAMNQNAVGYATCFADNVLTWHNDRQSGKHIQSKMPRILGHKKRTTALRVALSKLNLTEDRLALIENQLGCYDRTKPRPELPAVLKDRLDDQTFQELNRDFKRRPLTKKGTYHALLLELKQSIQQKIAGPALSPW